MLSLGQIQRISNRCIKDKDMANFNKTFELFRGIEFKNKLDILHRNKGEWLTYYGIHQKAHPHLGIWDIIKANIADAKGDLKVASGYLSTIDRLQEEVKDFYLKTYFLPLKLDKIKHQKVADEMFFFSIVQGSKKRAVKIAQTLVGVKTDGLIGVNTINALNSLDEDGVKRFDKLYDKHEVLYFWNLTLGNLKRFRRFGVGWINRAFRV